MMDSSRSCVCMMAAPSPSHLDMIVGNEEDEEPLTPSTQE
jgi:hypothetical protein